MQAQDGTIRFSPTDLNAFLECEHLTQLSLAVARGELEKPTEENSQADLVKRKGDEHEARYLADLIDDGRDVVRIEHAGDFAASARATEQAVRSGADVIYQACFVDGAWRGFADFVERQADGSYEVVDTKLARHSKPSYVLQLCFYSEQLARLQGGRLPARMHVVLGTHARESLHVTDFLAYYHRVRDRFVGAVAAGIDVYPVPVSFCPRCDFKSRCESRWIEDDHLSLVARLRGDQAIRLDAAGIHTVVELAEAGDASRPPTMAPRTFESLREQAAMQVAARSGVHTWKVLAPEPKRGFALLPPPSAGDLFFDIEGDPFWEPGRGLEYLWGFVDNARAFRPFWAHDRAQERRAVEATIDLIRVARAQDPRMHVYHYAAYEVSALKRLTCEYGTREDELDELLRGEVFVDLYKVVSQGLRLSHPRYGLKQVETFYFERTADLRAGDDSIVLYEDWLERRDPRILDDIADYNEEDCVSTLELRDWLLPLRPALAPEPEPPEPREPPDGAAETEQLRAGAARRAARRSARRSPTPTGRAGCWRSSSSTTAARRSRSGGRSSTRSGAPPRSCRSATRRRSAGSSRPGPPIALGQLASSGRSRSRRSSTTSVRAASVYDPATGEPAGMIDALDEEAGTLLLRRGPIARGRAAAGRAHARRPVLDARAAGGAAAPRARRARRRQRRIPRPSRSSCGSRSRRPSRRTTSTPRSSSSPDSTGSTSSSRARPARARPTRARG